MQGGVNPHRHRHPHRQDEGRHREPEAVPDAIPHQLSDRLLVRARETQVALYRPTQPLQVSDVDGLIQSVEVFQPDHVFGLHAWVRGDEQVDRIARGDGQQGEHQHGDPQCDGDHLYQPAEDVPLHALLLPEAVSRLLPVPLARVPRLVRLAELQRREVLQPVFHGRNRGADVQRERWQVA